VPMNSGELGLRPSKTLRVLFVAALATIVTACASVAPEDGRRSTTSKEGLSRWQPPESNATGQYEGLNGEGCVGGLKPGTQRLGEQLKQQFNVNFEDNSYSCRENTGSPGQLSIHAVGRALDLMTSGATGDAIANHLVTNAETLGIQLVIWNRTVWTVRPTGATSRAYTGSSPHTDHVHAEVNTATAQNGPGNATVDPNTTQMPDGTFDPNGTTTKPPASSSSGFNPGGQDQFDPFGHDDELECRMDIDCGKGGKCDAGFCW
jgi:hypothetical protein